MAFELLERLKSRFTTRLAHYRSRKRPTDFAEEAEIDSVGIRAAGPGRCGGSHRVLCLAVIELGENLAVAVVSHAPSNTKPAVLYFALWGATTHGTNDGA